jgi:hypothetical protein
LCLILFMMRTAFQVPMHGSVVLLAFLIIIIVLRKKSTCT